LVKATGINAGKTITDGNSQSFVVYYPKKLTWIALLMFFVGADIIGFMDVTAEPYEKEVMYLTSGVIGVVFLSLFIYISLMVEHFRVTVNIEKNITVYPIAGASYSFTSADIVSVKRKQNSYVTGTECFIIETNTGKKFRVVSTMISYNEFQRFLFESCGSLIR
jgi:hypothetical protein